MKTIIRRPVILSILCIVGYIWVVLTIPALFSPDTKRLGEWYPALFGAVVAFQFIAFIGIWHMKRWGVELFLVNFFFKTILHFLTGMAGDGGVMAGIVLTVFFTLPLLKFYPRMDRNL